MRPRLGVSILAVDAATWPDWCRRVEAAGLDELSMADHLTPGLLSPLPALAAAAAVTERVRLSTMVLNNELRHPAVLANEAAVVSELSAGRFTLGLGAGHAEAEHAAIGLPVPPPAQRIERLETTVVALRQLLDGETVTTTGPHPHLMEHRIAPVPSHRVPILVGGGARGVQAVAARHADVLGLTGFSARGGVAATTTLTHFSAEKLADRLDWVRTLPRDRSEPLRLQALVQVVTVTDDRRAAGHALLEKWGTTDLTLDEALESPFLLLGTVGEIAEQLHLRTEQYGIETWTVFAGRPVDPPLDDLARIAAAVDR
jgi:probable F420-dependent oxidoreductase